jgi:hypothetical protein
LIDDLVSSKLTFADGADLIPTASLSFSLLSRPEFHPLVKIPSLLEIQTLRQML